MLTEKYISTMASNFSSRTQANSRMNFGTRRIKYIKSITHWVQYFYRISGLPSIVGLSEVTFKPQLDRASTRDNISKSMSNQTKILADAALPGPLENEKQRNHWEEKFVNYARSYIGKNVVSLSYIICENEEPDINGKHTDFIYIMLLTECLFSIWLYHLQPSSHQATGSKQQ